MHLFISNFKKISRIIWIFLIVFTAYNIYLIVCTPKITHYQNQWQRNTATAQDFIYGKKAENIIVGSSLTARLNPQILPSDYFNLSFSGGSVLTGLEIIKKTAYIPKHIYVETNLILRFKSKKMINSLFYPVWWRVKVYIPALQEKNQPINVLLSKSLCSKQEIAKSTKNLKYYENLHEKINISRFNLMMKQRRIQYTKPLKAKHLKTLNRLISYFKKHGTKITFFEMPIEPTLADSKQAKQRRAILKANFNDPWLKLPDHEKYTTTDGHHLSPKSAYLYTKEFTKEVK